MKKKYSKWLPTASLLAAIVAIIISIRSCHIANESLSISSKEYYDKYKNIWIGEYNKVEKVFSIRPSNNDVLLQQGNVYFPNIISNEIWPIRLPDNTFHLTMAIHGMEKMVNSHYPRKDGHSQVLDAARIPIIIESNYSFNGDNLTDTSMYLIEYSAVIDDDPLTSPNIIINGLVYSHRLSDIEDPKEFINSIWNNPVE